MNTDLAYAGLGACEDYEFDLVEWIDGTLAPERAQAVRRHLDGCARCREFARELRAVDASLAAALPRVQLSADFDARLRERIGQASRSFSKDAARAQVEDEYRSALRSLRRGLTWRTALNGLAAAGVGAAVAFGLGTLLASATESLHPLAALFGAMTPYAVGLVVAAGFAAPYVLRRAPGALLG